MKDANGATGDLATKSCMTTYNYSYTTATLSLYYFDEKCKHLDAITK